MSQDAIETVAYILLAIIFLFSILGVIFTIIVERGNYGGTERNSQKQRK